MKSVFKKIILASLVAAFVAAPFQANALVGVGSVPVQLNGENITSGFTGLGAGGASSSLNTASSTCLTSESIASSVASTLTQGLSLLGDNPLQATGLQSQIKIIDGAITCWTGVITTASALDSTVGGSLFGFTKINANRDQAVTQIAALKNMRKQLEARLEVSSQSFWKAVLVGLLLKQTDHLAEKLVTEMTEKFKINDYSRYVGAVSDTVYTNSMILRYVDNDKDRAIVRSMIQNPFLRDNTHPAIKAAADAYVGFDPSNLSFADPKFTQGLGKIANGEEYMAKYQSAMIAKTDEVIAKAREAALSEVSQSGGYKSTLNNCGPSISAQKQKDLQYKAILDEIRDREALNKTIKASATASAAEKAQILKDVKDARSKLEKFTDTFGAAALQICEGTNTPAVKFKDTIHDLIGSQIDKFSDYNNNNLPLMQKLVVSIADNLINKFVFGENNVSTGQLIKESATQVVGGIAASIPKPSTGLNTTIPTFNGTTLTTLPPTPSGTVNGVETNIPFEQIMPRGPNITLR